MWYVWPASSDPRAESCARRSISFTATREPDLHSTLSILHVVAPAPFGGLESVLRALANGHRGRGHTVRVAAVLSLGEGPHPFTEALEADGVSTSVIRIG